MPGLGPVKLSVASATVALLDILSVEKLRHEPKPFAKLELSAFNTIAMSMVSAVQWHNAAYTPEMSEIVRSHFPTRARKVIHVKSCKRPSVASMQCVSGVIQITRKS